MSLDKPRRIKIMRKFAMHMGPTHMSPMPPMGLLGKGDYMSVQNAKRLRVHADKLACMVTPGIDLPDWAEQKLTLATDYVQSICNHLMYGQKAPMAKTRRIILIKKMGL